MSLNKLRNYSKYEIVNFEAKASKLGLINETDDTPVCISNTGDKSLVSRKLTTDDFAGVVLRGGTQTFYSQLTAKLNIMNVQDANVPIYNTVNEVGSRTVNCEDFKVGDYIKIKANGHYSTRTGQDELLRGIFLRLADTSQNCDYEIYTPPSTNIRELIYFPQAPLNAGFSSWSFEIYVTKIGLDGTLNNAECSGTFRSYGQTTAAGAVGSSVFSTFSKRLGTLDFRLTPTVGFNWKALAGASNVDADFQIWTDNVYVSKTSDVENAAN
tara:strand:- start:91 stop:897 length:807 start_codon:yes stop_codon:yes gene_type:complete